MSYEAIQSGYNWALLALTLLLLATGTGPMKRTVLALGAVWLAAFLLAPALWPSIWYSAAMIMVDLAAAIIITWHPAGKWQSIIGMSYAFQIAAHIGYVASMFFYGRADMFLFWIGLSVPAIVQLMLVGGWWAHGRIARSWGWRGPDTDNHSPVGQGMGQ